VDYRKLLEYFGSCGYLVRAHYFTARLDAPLTPDRLIRLIDWLSYHGFHVHTKCAKRFERTIPNDYGDRASFFEVNSGVEIEMTVEALRAGAYCDTIFIFSGSGELISTVKAV
jgi:uncharacterized LabA/DUF88 family protein